MPSIEILAKGSTRIVHIAGLKHPVKKTFVNDATGTIDITDEDDVAVGVQYALAYLAASDGEYWGVIPHTLVLDETEVYKITVVLSSATDGQLTIEMERPVRYVES